MSAYNFHFFSSNIIQYWGFRVLGFWGFGDQGNIGKLVTELAEWHRLIVEGAGTVENDVYNKLIEIVR